ncbi:peptidylprolyl isomerase [Microbulbifer sp. CAU 1566]|uniref:peptidylprolyl isomerase n=1 Tax=Microbulbifer sp. CAU 1566 TaxID=2933269 RepID=UPI00200403BF|nr:peptidylprolyl isomerase [Microbulbifer sp. CAU 1566]MCK7597668.1 peptidylprolyl isomerase [Microbulbifer sp. CAU 1566]
MHVKFSLPQGTIKLKLFSEQAPASCQYFIEDIESGRFASGNVFRIVNHQNDTPEASPPIAVVQLGHIHTSEDIAPSIAHETTEQTGLRHRRGTVSLARYAPGAVYHSVFICMEDCPSLDFGGTRHPDGQGFAAFAEVTSGMEVLQQVFALAETKDYLQTPIPITGATLVRD